MIVVDTSVWVDAFRHPGDEHANTLRRLLEADEVALALPVRLELMAGAARRDRRDLRRGLSGLPVLVPSDETWQHVEEWVVRAADAGHRFAVTDLLIAGLAADVGGLVWSLDDDFARMEAVGLIRRYC